MAAEEIESTLKTLAQVVGNLQVEVKALRVAVLHSKATTNDQIERAMGQVEARQRACAAVVSASTPQTRVILERTLQDPTCHR